MPRVCSLLYFYGSCCEMEHWWCRVRNAFLLVRALLSSRGLSSYDSVGDQYTLSTCSPPPQKLISCTLVARVLFVPLTRGLMSHSSSHLNLAGQRSTVISSKCRAGSRSVQ